MSNLTTTTAKFSVAIKSETYQNLINSTLGDKEIARQFVADISTVVSNNPALQSCDAASILSAGLTAQSLKLPLSPTLGNAYIIPYGNKAQFQVGYKGLLQLAIRSGQFARIGVKPVHKGEPQGLDEFGDEVIKFSHDFDNEPTVGYYAYFELTNGYKKTLYWTKEQCEKHGHKYSKSYSKLWGDPAMFDAMASKTVLKMLLKYAPMSVEMEKAVKFDQAAIDQNGNPDYVDRLDETPTERRSVKAPSIDLGDLSDETEVGGGITQATQQNAPNAPKTDKYGVLDDNELF